MHYLFLQKSFKERYRGWGTIRAINFGLLTLKIQCSHWRQYGGTGQVPQKWSGDTNIDVPPKVSACFVH